MIKHQQLKSIKKSNKSNLICDIKHRFCNYHNSEKCNNLFLKSKYSFSIKFYYDLEKFNKSTRKKTLTKKINLYEIQLQNWVMSYQKYI